MQKLAWIIGASSGIGRAVAIKLSQEGYNLALSARSQEALEETCTDLDGASYSTVHPCDVSNLKSLKAAFQDIIERHGKIDLMIFSAGIYQPMPLKELDYTQALATLNVNLMGALNVFETIKARALSKKHPLHLVWIGSVAGYRGLPNANSYGVSKAGLINFAELQKIELKNCNTKVQLVSPGFVKTRLTDKNKFQMPMIISPEQSADYIIKGMRSHKFEIAFPPIFALTMKVLRILPDFIFFKISDKIK